MASFGAYSASMATVIDPFDRIDAGTSAATVASLVAPNVWVGGNCLLKFRCPAPQPVPPPPLVPPLLQAARTVPTRTRTRADRAIRIAVLLSNRYKAEV